jgi:FkbM family methyltransferase
MSYIMPKWLQILARKFPGTRKSLASFTSIKFAKTCKLEDITFHFDKKLMDRKRFVAIAAGAIETEEVEVAKSFLNKSDILVEFGAGLGIAAARVNRAARPKKHICFEANPKLIEYAKKIFSKNKIDIKLEMSALGDGEELPFYSLDDYILSSFQKPTDRDDFNKIIVPTISLEQVINQYQPSAIFCDVEGAELNYLDATDFGSVKTIILELHPNVYGSEGVLQFHKRMAKHGFTKKLKNGDAYCFTRC